MLKRLVAGPSGVIYADNVVIDEQDVLLPNTGDSTLTNGQTIRKIGDTVRLYLFLPGTESFIVSHDGGDSEFGGYTFKEDIAENQNYDGGNFDITYGASAFEVENYKTTNWMTRILYLSGVQLTDEIISDFDDAGEDSLQCFVVETTHDNIKIEFSDGTYSFNIEPYVDGQMQYVSILPAVSHPYNIGSCISSQEDPVPLYPLPWQQDERLSEWRWDIVPEQETNNNWTQNTETVFIHIRRTLTGVPAIDKAIADVILEYLRDGYSSIDEVAQTIDDIFHDANYDFPGDTAEMLQYLFPVIRTSFAEFDGSLDAAKAYADAGGFEDLVIRYPGSTLRDQCVYLSADWINAPSAALNPLEFMVVIQPKLCNAQLCSDSFDELLFSIDGEDILGKLNYTTG